MIHVRLTISHEPMAPQRQPIIYVRQRHIKLDLKHQQVVSINPRNEEIGSSRLVSYLTNFYHHIKYEEELERYVLKQIYQCFYVSIDLHLYTLEWRPHWR